VIRRKDSRHFLYLKDEFLIIVKGDLKTLYLQVIYINVYVIINVNVVIDIIIDNVVDNLVYVFIFIDICNNKNVIKNNNIGLIYQKKLALLYY